MSRPAWLAGQRRRIRKNPHLAPRADVVDAIAAHIADGFDEAHALIVRPNAAGYQIVSGHHRALAAAKAGSSRSPRDLYPNNTDQE
jgi:hypothetical protein